MDKKCIARSTQSSRRRKLREAIASRNPLVFVLTLGVTFVGAAGTVVAQTVESRISTILSQMTMEEKIKQLHAEGGFNTADNTRLGIPGFLMADGPHGVREGTATSFPVGIGMAATWDIDLARRVGEAMGREFRGKGKNQALGPCLDIDRDPRNGRSPETGGEDPYLCAQIASAVVRGIQSTPVVATIKHFNANHRENGRFTNNIIASERVLHDHAGLPFRTAVQEAGAFSVMNAYTLINGQKCAENPALLTTILRTHWGFPYYVVSDWGSIWNTEYAIKAGCDICMGSDLYRNDLPALVATGTVPVSVIDEAVRRVLRTKMLAGMLDYLPPGNPDDVNSAAHRQLCLEAGRKSLVLLKNDGNILPLDKSTGTVALVGPNAAVAPIDGAGSAYVTPLHSVTPRQGIEAAIGAIRVQYVKGCDINSSDTSGFASARFAALTSDVVIFVGGLDPGQEGEGFDRVGGSIELPGKQQDLVNAMAAVNPNVVAVVFSGGICGLSRCIGSAKGLLYAFYPGQEGGAALADVLFGDVTPGGKLPVTMPMNDGQLPPWNDNLNDDFGCGYRWFDKQGYVPRFPFGFGMSYTSFAYSNLAVSPASVAPGVPVTVSVDVTNTGSRSGEEVAQLYLSDLQSSVPVSVKELKGFRRVSLAPGETQRVSFVLTADELYFFNEGTGSYDVEAGTFMVRVGGSSDNLPLSSNFDVVDGPRKPDLRVTGIRMVPPYPVIGEQVIFLATVKNQGTAPSPEGIPVKTSFTVNGIPVSWSTDTTSSIPAGGMTLICGNAGPSGRNTWTADIAGTFTVAGVVDPDQAIDECVEENNNCAAELTVYSEPPRNLALRKSVAVTSVQEAGLEGQYAVDGNMGTRWSSAFSDPQAITVDLGAIYSIDDIVLYWEAAFGREYIVKIFDGAGGWMDIWHEVNGDGGMDKIAVGASGRKIMMLGLQRGTTYGYSLYEVEVHGTLATDAGETAHSGMPPERFLLAENYPNPFNPQTVISAQWPVASDVKLVVYDALGREVVTLADGRFEAGKYEFRFDGRDLSSGIYVYRLITGQFSQSRKMLLLK